MTFEELLKACSSGELPTVEFGEKKGRVTAIKDNGRHMGCSVKFPDLDYDVWFHGEPGTDKRSNYMSYLTLTQQ